MGRQNVAEARAYTARCGCAKVLVQTRSRPDVIPAWIAGNQIAWMQQMPNLAFLGRWFLHSMPE
jgi:hypothetical protein